jgi:hypothetical protein
MRAQEFVKDVEGIDVSLEIQKDDVYVDDGDTDNQVVFVKATSNGRELGHVLFTMSYDGQGLILNPQDLEIDERYRGQGIAKIMYDFVKSKGYRIRRSGQQTDAGAAFWQRHRPGQNVWESFDQPYPIKWEKGEHGDYDALATLGDGTYLSIMFNNEGDDEYQIEFHRNNSQAVTGEGDAQRVFATVLKAIQEFLKVEQPWRFIFSASKDVEPGQSSQSRARLYDRLIQRYAGVWGYDVYYEDHGDQVTYELTRKKGLEENFADGKKPGRKGLSKRVGIPKKATLGQLEKIAKSSTGERRRMAQWQLNMRRGKAKKAK